MKRNNLKIYINNQVPLAHKRMPNENMSSKRLNNYSLDTILALDYM